MTDSMGDDDKRLFCTACGAGGLSPDSTACPCGSHQLKEQPPPPWTGSPTSLIKRSLALRKSGLGRTALQAQLREEADDLEDPPPDEVLEKIVEEVMRHLPAALPTAKEVEKALGLSVALPSSGGGGAGAWTQDGYASSFKDANYSHSRWVQEDQERWWHCSTGNFAGIWSRENKGKARGAMRDLIRAANPRDVSAAMVNGALALAGPSMAARPQEFDRHPWMLGVKGGVVDLETGELKEPQPDLLLARRVPYSYDPEAKCDLWEENLRRLMQDDPGRIRLFHQAVGMSLVGDASAKDHGFIFVLGPEGNGKSTVLKVCGLVLGHGIHGLAHPINARDLTNSERHMAWMTALKGTRLAYVPELKRQRIDVAKLNTLTGADPITANKMRQEDETWEASHTLFIASNYPPNVGTDTAGLKRRYRPVETGPGVGEKEDTGFQGKLLGEAEGILAWMVRGCLEWQANKRKLPVVESVENLRDEHLSAANVLNDWAAEQLVFEPCGFISRPDVSRLATMWLTTMGASREVSRTEVYDWLRRQQGVTESQRKGEGRGFSGVRKRHSGDSDG